MPGMLLPGTSWHKTATLSVLYVYFYHVYSFNCCCHCFYWVFIILCFLVILCNDVDTIKSMLWRVLIKYLYLYLYLYLYDA